MRLIMLAVTVLGLLGVVGQARGDILLTASPSSERNPILDMKGDLYMYPELVSGLTGLTASQIVNAQGSDYEGGTRVSSYTTYVSFDWRFYTNEPSGLNGAFFAGYFDTGDDNWRFQELGGDLHATAPGSPYAYESDWQTFTLPIGDYYPGFTFSFLDMIGVYEADGSSAAIDIRNFGAFSTPEPSALIVASLGALGFIGYAWRRRRTTPAI